MKSSRYWVANTLMLNLCISLLVYAYIYFYPFSQGNSEAPLFLKASKDIVLIGGPLVIYVITRERLLRNYLLYILSGALVFGFIFWMSWISQEGLLAAKSLLIPAAFAYLVFAKIKDTDLFIWTTWVMFFQVVLSLLLNTYLRLGWEGGDMVGTLGNPNQFGLMCNLSIIFSLVNKERFERCLPIVLGVLSVGCLLSASLSQIIIWICGMLASLFWYSKDRIRLIGILSSLFIVFPICQYFWKVFNYRIFISAAIYLYELVAGVGTKFNIEGLTVNSLSITGRDRMFDAFKSFYYDSSWREFLTGAQGRFIPYDNQYITFAYNYGMIAGWIFVLFLFCIFICIFFGRNLFDSSINYLLFGLFFCFSTTFMFTRILYYYPGGLYFFYFIFWCLRLFLSKDILRSSILNKRVQKI